MIDELIALALAPLLLAQGRRARRLAQSLPEAAGSRTGNCGTGAAALRVLLVGDSAVAGVGVATQDQALAGQLARVLHGVLPGTVIEWRVVARSGVNTRQALAMLAAEEPEQFDLAVVALGVNDVTARVSIGTWLARIGQLVEQIRGDWGARQIWLSGLPPMHRFPLLPQPLRWFLGRRARRFSTALGAWAARRPGLHYVALPDMTNPTLIAADGFHPGPGAVAIWAWALARDIATHFDRVSPVVVSAACG
ncbi:MAG: SGNH/GDSL hydrolase family protein [Burkholderiaceae bacterium]|nr:SGNH/GDSL hydrolase family protein [Burkholderiaceae bacterium]